MAVAATVPTQTEEQVEVVRMWLCTARGSWQLVTWDWPSLIHAGHEDALDLALKSAMEEGEEVVVVVVRWLHKAIVGGSIPTNMLFIIIIFCCHHSSSSLSFVIIVTHVFFSQRHSVYCCKIIISILICYFVLTLLGFICKSTTLKNSNS